MLDLGKCGRQNIWTGALFCAACHLSSQSLVSISQNRINQNTLNDEAENQPK